jgi:hypothetical protein
MESFYHGRGLRRRILEQARYLRKKKKKKENS